MTVTSKDILLVWFHLNDTVFRILFDGHQMQLINFLRGIPFSGKSPKL